MKKLILGLMVLPFLPIIAVLLLATGIGSAVIGVFEEISDFIKE